MMRLQGRLIFAATVVLMAASGNPAQSRDLNDCRMAVEAYDSAVARYRQQIPPGAPAQPDAADEDAGQQTPESRVERGVRKVSNLRATGGLKLATALTELAAARQSASQFQRALDDLRDADAILAGLAASEVGRAKVHRLRAIVLSNMRKREEAAAEIEKAIDLYRSGPAADAALLALNNRTKSDILRGLNRFTDALDALVEAEDYYQARGVDGVRELIEVLLDKSIILSRLNDKTQQLATAQRAATLAESQLGLASRTTARAFHNVAIGHRVAGNYPVALAALAGTIAIYDAAAAKRQSAEALEEVARTFNVMNCFDTAVQFQSQAIAAYVSRYGATHSLIATAKHRLGSYLRSMGTFDLAFGRYGEAAAMYDALLGPDNVRTAVVLRDRADLLLSLGRHAEALNDGFASLRALERVTAPEEQRRSLQVLSQILQAMGERDAAILFAKRAVNKQQDIRSQNRNLPPDLAQSFADRYRDLYLYLSGLLIAEGRLAEAQRVIDLIKTQEVIDFVRGESASGAGRAPLTGQERKALGDLDRILKQPVAVSSQLEALLSKARNGPLSDAEKRQMDSLKMAYQDNYKTFQNDIKALLASLSRESATVQVEVERLHLDMMGQARNKLRQFEGRAVMLQIASLEDSVHLFLTTTHAPVHRQSAMPRRQLAQLAYDAWNATAQGSPVAGLHLQALYDVLIRPVEADLRASGADVIMLNLEGFLRYVPFAALKDGERYLIEDYALAMQTPAAATVYAMGDRDRTRAVGFGVTLAHGDFPGLPAVGRELESIFSGADATGVLDGTPRLDADFSADEFAAALEAGPQFVHIASHFKLEPGDESKSFLLLGNGDPLPLEAIRNDARYAFTGVDLLTLSACETAGEVGSDGKEVESFATLAQGSGASSVMATLWPIADASTAELMGTFYRELIDRSLDKATALRAAQVAMLRGVEAAALPFVTRGASSDEEQPASAEARHPYYWSAFILMGNWL